jgi:hypothetical protein
MDIFTLKIKMNLIKMNEANKPVIVSFVWYAKVIQHEDSSSVIVLYDSFGMLS